MKAETLLLSRFDPLLFYHLPKVFELHLQQKFYLAQVVVIIVIWIISLLVIYMLFLVCLDPLLNKKTQLPYQEQNNEEVQVMGFHVPFKF